MNLENLDNLVKAGHLKKESYDQGEFLGLVKSGKTRLHDSENTTLAPESRFDLAYNAAHSLALAALRWHGYRPDKRYIVFQSLQHTLDVDTADWRLLDKCHNKRNVAEYEGDIDVDDQLVNDLIDSAKTVLERVEKLDVKPNDL